MKIKAYGLLINGELDVHYDIYKTLKEAKHFSSNYRTASTDKNKVIIPVTVSYIVPKGKKVAKRGKVRGGGVSVSGGCGGEEMDETNLCPRFDAVEAVDVGARIDDPAHGGLIETDATRNIIVAVFRALRPLWKRGRGHTRLEKNEKACVHGRGIRHSTAPTANKDARPRNSGAR